MSALVTGIRCDGCGTELDPILWSELGELRHSFCAECRRKKVNYKVDRGEFTMNFGHGIYSHFAPKYCQGNGIKDCLECPLKTCQTKDDY